MAETSKFLVDLGTLCDFAYAQGFHELGYDPVKAARDEIERLRAALARVIREADRDTDAFIAARKLLDRPADETGAASPVVTDEMVNRFLSWRLPQDFLPDCGITFTPLKHPNSWPVGTNLLTAVQARMMLGYVMGGSERGYTSTDSDGPPQLTPADVAAMQAVIDQLWANKRRRSAVEPTSVTGEPT